MKYKYGKENFDEYFSLLSDFFYRKVPLKDFSGNSFVYSPAQVQIVSQSLKQLMQTYSGEKYGAKAMEDEIVSTLSIEKIDTTRESVREILAGRAPLSQNEEKAYGIKKGLDFISDPSNKITAENLNRLYRISINDFLDPDVKLPPGAMYRNDSVYVVDSSGKPVHSGLDYEKLPAYTDDLIAFINDDCDEIDQVLKSAMIHYYFAYLHPYFDGNGRTARLLQLWYLVQKEYTSALFIPFSLFVNQNRNDYYKSFKRISENHDAAKVSDMTPFLYFFTQKVFSQFENYSVDDDVFEKFRAVMNTGKVTEKEKELFTFVLSNYGGGEFSTKDLEKDFRNVAYATVRTFVLKFEEFGLLKSQKYGARVKYRINEIN
ncbi:Fic family protein [Methanimicrococcus hongohii]|uniref:Fic family protein n=1 Tax=Methanimicrococcus hongohii TaxID=3028295 RepID=UPI00292E18F2|nr:Fic family protein [Methanimicrococcus sp. Hf6]